MEKPLKSEKRGKVASSTGQKGKKASDEIGEYREP